MTKIYRPKALQLDVDSLMKRYDKRQSKRNQAAETKSPAAESPTGKPQNGGTGAGELRNMDARRNRRGGADRMAQRAERRRQMLAQSYQTAIDTVEALAVPHAIYTESSEGGVGQLRTWLPNKATGAYIGLCTLGEKLDSHMGELTESDFAGAAILNEVALAWIVAITQDMRQQVSVEVAPNGYKVGAAYRPGVGRWPLQAQTIVFKELPTEEIGVRLTEALLMLPSFSTSIVIPTLPT